MELLYCFLALIAGACAPTQAGINSQLRLWTEDPVLAATISFGVGTLALFIYATVLRTPWPSLSTATELPWWVWSGGLLGGFLVAVTIVLAPKLGAATMMGFMVTGQLVAGMVLDHYALVGYEAKPFSFWRLVGTLLLLGGVILIKKF
jgi:bacterial/archaeal transporter family-2 protein